jgi:hypothetical protein
MTPEDTLRGSSLASHYDSKAEEYGWRGPEVVFGLSKIGKLGSKKIGVRS